MPGIAPWFMPEWSMPWWPAGFVVDGAADGGLPWSMPGIAPWFIPE